MEYLVTVIVALLVLLAIAICCDTFFMKVPPGKSLSTTSMSPVSVVIISDNNASELRRYLDVFLQQEYEPGYEVIVVVCKDEDGTSDVLKPYLGRPGFYTTFVPDTSRYMSKHKLAVTLGVKAAKHPLVLLTDADCCPLSNRWIATMAAQCTDDVDVVCGYSNYPADECHYKRFYRLHKDYALMREASAGRAYSTFSRNLLFRKDEFMQRDGFLGNLEHLRGEYAFMLNKYALGDSVAVCLSEEGQLVEQSPSHKMWRNKNVFYEHTHKGLARGRWYKCQMILETSALYACLLSSLAVTTFSAYRSDWLLMAVSLLVLLTLVLLKLLLAKRAMKLFSTHVPLMAVLPFELFMVWSKLAFAIRYRLADKYDFVSHKQ